MSKSPPKKIFLNVGSGHRLQPVLPPWLSRPDWQQVQLDIEPKSQPDICCSATDMHEHVANELFDAVWACNLVEHLHAHEVELALREFARVTKPDGLVQVWVPDLARIARLIIDGNLEGVAYDSPAGAIAPIDILYGHRAAIASGLVHMAHKTGFIAATLQRALIAAGLSHCQVIHDDWNLLGIASKTTLDKIWIPPELASELRSIKPAT